MAACTHLENATTPDPPDDLVCQDCAEIGGQWVHLRQCLECERVVCCDSSPNKHATAHSRATGHPVVRSVEPGEHWRWCYVDEEIG